MYIENGVYSELTIKWTEDMFPLREGTPMSLGGVVANDGGAVGLIVDTYNIRPLFPVVRVLVGGTVRTEDVNKAWGHELTDAAKAAMRGITFLDEHGAAFTPAPPAPYVLPAATAAALGGVKQAANVAEAEGEAPTAAEFKALLDALIAAGIMAAPSAN